MNTTAILSPAFALAGWTIVVLLLIAYRRLRAGFQGRVLIKAFRLGESAAVPEDVALPNRNYMNLLELPVLFYVVCTIAVATQHVTSLAVTLAWAYVALRVVHSLVHVTYNHVIHRFAVFATSNLVLAGLWCAVGYSVFA